MIISVLLFEEGNLLQTPIVWFCFSIRFSIRINSRLLLFKISKAEIINLEQSNSTLVRLKSYFRTLYENVTETQENMTYK